MSSAGGQGNPDPGVMAGGGGGAGGGGLLRILNTPTQIGISSRGTKPRDRTALENRARTTADGACASFRADIETWSDEEVFAAMRERLVADDLKDIRSFVVGKMSGKLWQEVYNEEIRSAVDRLADLGESDVE